MSIKQPLTLFDACLFTDNISTNVPRWSHICVTMTTGVNAALLSKKVSDESIERGVGGRAAGSDQLHYSLDRGLQWCHLVVGEDGASEGTAQVGVSMQDDSPGAGRPVTGQ